MTDACLQEDQHVQEGMIGMLTEECISSYMCQHEFSCIKT